MVHKIIPVSYRCRNYFFEYKLVFFLIYIERVYLNGK